MAKYFSASQNCFYDTDFWAVSDLPADKVLVSDADYNQLMADQCSGKKIVADGSGHPCSQNQGGSPCTKIIVDGTCAVMDSSPTENSNNAVTSGGIYSAMQGGQLAVPADTSVTTAKIADKAVTTAKIDNGAVTSIKIADSAVTTAKIKDGAVFADKIANYNVTTDKIDDGAVTTDKIAGSAVTTAKIANGSVNGDKLADGAVYTAKIANGTITTNKIANLAITTAEIANAAVTTAKIADGAVTKDKLTDEVFKSRKVDSGTSLEDVDFNTFDEVGFYTIACSSTSQNCPPENDHIVLMVFKWNDRNIRQICIGFNGIYLRNKINNVWQSTWTTIS